MPLELAYPVMKAPAFLRIPRHHPVGLFSRFFSIRVRLG
jgi:hypothetical protein